MSNTYKDSYESRNSGEDMADIAMQNYLKKIELVEYKDYLRIGTDPKINKLDLFWYATEILLLPDYIVVQKGHIFFVFLFSYTRYCYFVSDIYNNRLEKSPNTFSNLIIIIIRPCK